MTREETKQLLALITSVYPYYYSKKSDMELRLAVTGWFISLQNYSLGYVLSGITPILQTCEYPPTIAEVLKSSEKVKQEAYNILGTGGKNREKRIAEYEDRIRNTKFLE